MKTMLRKSMSILLMVILMLSAFGGLNVSADDGVGLEENELPITNFGEGVEITDVQFSSRQLYQGYELTVTCVAKAPSGIASMTCSVAQYVPTPNAWGSQMDLIDEAASRYQWVIKVPSFHDGDVTCRIHLADNNGYGIDHRETLTYGEKPEENNGNTSEETPGEEEEPVFTGLKVDEGVFKYYEEGEWISNKYGFVEYDNHRFLVANGVLAMVDGLVMDPNGTVLDWYFCSEGRILQDHSGFCMYDNEWFLVTDGKLAHDATGFYEYDGGLFYMAEGRLLREANGLKQDPQTGEWFFCSLGQAQTEYSGLALYDDTWFYVENGYFDPTKTGYVEYNGETFYVENGTLSEEPSNQDPAEDPSEKEPEEDPSIVPGEEESLKVGIICLFDQYSSQDAAYLSDFVRASAAENVEYVLKTNISEDMRCMDAIDEMVEYGCSLIISTSYGHALYMRDAAEMYPEVEFCVLGAQDVYACELTNYHGFNAAAHEGRYLSGVAAGMKLEEMIAAGTITKEEAKLGFVAAFCYAECVSGYSAFYLGAKSVCPSVTMDVLFTGSWYSYEAERDAAKELIANGAKVVSQYSDSMGVPVACEEAGVPNIAYLSNHFEECPNTCILSFNVDWYPYFKYAIGCMKNGEKIAKDWTGTLSTGTVFISDVNPALAAQGTKVKLNEVKADLISGKSHVFEADMLETPVGTPISMPANLGTYTDPIYVEMLSDGYYHEGEYRSAPTFESELEGITKLNQIF